VRRWAPMYMPPQIGKGEEQAAPARPNRRQRRAQAVKDRRKAKELQQRLEAQAKRAFERMRQAREEGAADDYTFG